MTMGMCSGVQSGVAAFALACLLGGWGGGNSPAEADDGDRGLDSVRSFPFTLDSTPLVVSGGEGSWDAGGAFGPRAFRSQGRTVLLYVGMLHGDPFDNVLSLGVALESSDGAFTKYAGNPVLEAKDLHDGATGVEMIALVEGGDDAVVFIATLVDERRVWVGQYRVSLSLPDWRVTSVTSLAATPRPSGDWNTDFYLAGAFDDESGLLLGEGTGGGRPWSLGAQRLADDSLVWVDDPATGSPFSASDPILQGTPGGWDRDGVFNPYVASRAGDDILVYSGAPGAAGVSDLRHTIGYATGSGTTWTKPSGEGRLIKPKPGALIEHPFLLQDQGGQDQLFVTLHPWPQGKYAIHVAHGRLPEG